LLQYLTYFLIQIQNISQLQICLDEIKVITKKKIECEKISRNVYIIFTHSVTQNLFTQFFFKKKLQIKSHLFFCYHYSFMSKKSYSNCCIFSLKTLSSSLILVVNIYCAKYFIGIFRFKNIKKNYVCYRLFVVKLLESLLFIVKFQIYVALPFLLCYCNVVYIVVCC
jgi:hypothetical protein